jgi:hypothetical protein
VSSTTTVYLSSAALEQVNEAQDVMAIHAVFASTEKCVVCGVTAPCDPRSNALRALRRYGLLPKRRPGATRPELIGLVHAGRPQAYCEHEF